MKCFRLSTGSFHAPRWTAFAANLALLVLWGWLFHPVYHYLGVIFSRQEFRTNQIVLLAVGMVLLSFVDVNTTKTQLALFMAALGLGMGFLMQTTMLIAQNSVEQKDLGVASSTATLFRSIGGSFGVALFGTIFARQFESGVAASLGPEAAAQIASGGGQVDPAVVAAMPAPVKLAIYDAIASSLGTVFVWAIPFAAVVAILAVFIREVALRGHDDEPASIDA